MAGTDGFLRSILCHTTILVITHCLLTIGLEPPYKCHVDYFTDPTCIDHPDGYGCECGPGFYWNTFQCISTAIDTRFEFRASTPPRYTLLLGKAFPRLAHFTISLWLNVTDSRRPGTVLSYRHGSVHNVLRMQSGPTLQLEVWGVREDTGITLQAGKWYHITWTWTSTTGDWRLYINGGKRQHGVKPSTVRRVVPLGGEFVLGQSFNDSEALFTPTLALDGDLAHLNIWNYVMGDAEVASIKTSCMWMYCGNAVQWVEFRSGTRGGMKMRWPSGIYTGECFDEKVAGESCDKFCSDKIGAQCDENILENIRWTRTKAERNISIVCPGQEAMLAQNFTVDYAMRECKLQENDNDGIWDIPHIDSCISDSLRELKMEFERLERREISEINVLRLADMLLNHTEENTYTNPIDIATVIDLLEILVKTQGVTPRTVTWLDGGITFARTEEVYPTFEHTKLFCQLFADIVNNLLDDKNTVGWNATTPIGVEGDNLLTVMHMFARVISRSLVFHVKDGIVLYNNARVKVFRENIEFKIVTEWIEEFSGARFPDQQDVTSDGLDPRDGAIRALGDAFHNSNETDLQAFVGVSTFRYANLARNLPNVDKKGRTIEDRVNTPIMALYLHVGDRSILHNLTSPLIIDFPILNTFNISNPECVRLAHRYGRRKWEWSRDNCEMQEYLIKTGRCKCSTAGVFAITTDMYDVNWDKGDKRPILLNFASYTGCSLAAALCLLTFAVHTYFRTSSTTAALHRNQSLSIACSQFAFMFGIDRYDHPLVCQVFAILLHYFCLTSYMWIMNETFNLYTVITYSQHTQNELSDTGSLLRYHIIGWIIPGVLVGAFVGTYSDNYYAPDMCWIAWEHVWLFIGPAVGIICVTILVLIFTAKEHNENSYTKSEKANKTILVSMKGLWTQIILVTVVWSFAFISITMIDYILKYLFALFNILQGSFFVVFNLLLNDELRGMMKINEKRKALTSQGYDFPDDHSLDSMTSNVLDKQDGDNSAMETKLRWKKEHCRRRQKAHIEASSEEGSDCEMITTV